MQRPEEVTRALLEKYRQHVFTYRTRRDDTALSLNTQSKRLVSVRQFFQWLTRQHHLLYNPASELELPRQPQRLPRHILSVAEVEQVLDACNAAESPVKTKASPIGNALGLRDRAMLETLYSTGMRRAELTGLRIDDVDLARGTVFVREGKGRKDRVVPIGERACRWIEKYLFSLRPELLDMEDDGALFLAQHGGAMEPKQASVIVRKAIQAAQLERFQDAHPNAACHLLRHACATHMLEGGADIRYIQALLGHADLSTTEVYARVSIVQLKAVHERTHPARLRGQQAPTREASQSAIGGLPSADHAPADTEGAADARASFLAALQREAERDGAGDAPGVAADA